MGLGRRENRFWEQASRRIQRYIWGVSGVSGRTPRWPITALGAHNEFQSYVKAANLSLWGPRVLHVGAGVGFSTPITTGHSSRAGPGP